MKTESLFQSDPEDIFAKAIERVEAGEAIEAVLATAPEAIRAELQEVLLLITATHHLQRAPVPQPPAPRRADRKKAFLAAATQMKAEAALDTPPAVTPAPVVKAQAVKPRQAKATRITDLAAVWRNFLDSFNSPKFSLAPLATIIVAVYLGVFGFNEAAQAAEMGDLTYPIKQWLGYQALSLSSDQVRPDLYGDLEVRLAKDVSKAHQTLSTEEATNGRKVAIITTESFLLVKGVEEEYLLVGPLRVLMKYQPDPNVDEYVAMEMSDIPGINSQVELTFQVIANEETPNEPLAVQGRALKVITDGQLTFDNSQAKTPVPPPPTPIPCNVAKPTGWEPALVQEGEMLTTVAERLNADLAALIVTNCLDGIGNTIPAGMVMILAPKPVPTSTPTPAEPELVVTLTIYAEKTLTPAVEFTATVVPTNTTIVTATVVPTNTVVTTATVAPTNTVVMTATPEITGTLSVTGTPEASETITATLVPTTTTLATPSATVTVTLTGQPTENTELKGTLTATAPISGGVEPPTGTPIAPPLTGVSTPETPLPETPTPAATPITDNEGSATPSPTEVLESTVLPTLTLTPTPLATLSGSGGGTSGQAVPTVGNVAATDEPAVLPTATATPIPQNRSPLTGG